MPKLKLKVTRNGRTVRLCAPEGTYSCYHPTKLFTDFSWDALSAAGLLASRSIRDVIVLGLGGGTCARQCRALYPDARIVGVEADQEILVLARREFALDAIGLEVILLSGQAFMHMTHRRFDLIIDDMWPAEPYSPKVIQTDRSWVDLIFSRLRAGGVYAINLYSRDEYPAEFLAVSSVLRRRFGRHCEVRPQHGQSTAIAAGNAPLSPRSARMRIRGLKIADAACLSRLTFRSL